MSTQRHLGAKLLFRIGLQWRDHAVGHDAKSRRNHHGHLRDRRIARGDLGAEGIGREVFDLHGNVQDKSDEPRVI